MKHIIPTFCAVFLLTAAPVMAAPELPVDNRIRILTYSPQDVFTIPTKYGFQTNIVFANNEEIATVSVGERSMWQIVPSHNRIFIRPMDDNLVTNMTVITNMREYNFDIKSGGPDDKGNLYVVQFRYPDKKDKLIDSLNDSDATPARDEAAPVKLTPRQASSANAPTIPPLDTQRTQGINTSYSYTGPDAVAPADVFDDGKNTYVVYNNALPDPAPVPMVMGASGPAVAAHRIDGNRIIMQTVASGFKLVSPSGDITVYNELFHSN
jgi:type IV secretion system protein VirB9